MTVNLIPLLLVILCAGIAFGLHFGTKACPSKVANMESIVIGCIVIASIWLIFSIRGV